MDDLEALFAQGVRDYWAGELPNNWNNSELRARSPYLTGWYMASMSEVDPDWLEWSDDA